MEETLIPIAFFLMIFAILYVYYTSRAKERVALAQKDINPSTYSIENTNLILLKWGIFMIALSVGIIGGYVLSDLIHEVVAFFSCILLSGGIGLMLAYYVARFLSKKEE